MHLKTVTLVFGITAILGCSSEKFFRRDYTYNEKYDAFYKLHGGENSRDWKAAFITCDDEGAKLFYPEAPEEWMIAGNLSETLTGVDNILVGIRDEFGRGHFVSVDGRFNSELSNYNTNQNGSKSKCVHMSVTTGSYSVIPCELKRPFICRKIDNESCPTVDSDYVYSKSAKKCYKINKSPKSWQDAVTTCYMEGAILSTFPSKTESVPFEDLKIDYTTYHIGVRKILPMGSFYNLQGSKYELLPGELMISETYPMQLLQDENCIALKLYNNENKLYNNNKNENNKERNQKILFYKYSHNCNLPLPFICEMQARG